MTRSLSAMLATALVASAPQALVACAPLALVACAPLALVACAPQAPPVSFRIVHGVGDDPFDGADALVVALERDGVIVPGTEHRFSPDVTSVDLPELPFGERLAIRVETRLGEFVLGRGRSFPFDQLDGEPQSAAPDVLIGTLGRFAITIEQPGPRVCTIAPTARGALIAAGARWLEYVAHDETGAPSLLERDPLPPDHVWTAIHDRLLGIGRTLATSITSEGALVSLAVAIDSRPLAIAAMPDGRAIAVLESGTVVRLDVRVTSVLATPIAALVELPGAPQIVVIETTVGARAVISDRGVLTLIDPEGVDAPHALVLDPPRVHGALVAVGPSTALLAGGRDPLDATTAVDHVTAIVVRPDDPDPLVLLRLPRLVPARSDAVTASLGPELVLVAGGLSGDGRPLRTVEIVDAAIPGDVVVTGSLPFDAIGCAARLADRTVLAIGETGAAVFFPPRER